jgi:tRNA1(Val) A37 N6-methylase TrmN6
VTLDGFLGGRVTATQPSRGFRAGHYTVLLAAAVPADANSVALELGAGAGIASLCLAARVPDVRITGIDNDPELVRLANENAARNGVSDRVSFIAADLAEPNLITTSPLWGGGSAVAKQGALGGGTSSRRFGDFDHVFFNPPFHPPSGHTSPVAARDRATRDVSRAVREWTLKALALVRDAGTVTAILRADRTDEILDAATGFAGVVFPLFPRKGEQPKRVIVRVVKASGDFHRASGLILHENDGRNTDEAERVLRHAKPLDVMP